MWMRIRTWICIWKMDMNLYVSGDEETINGIWLRRYLSFSCWCLMITDNNETLDKVTKYLTGIA